LTFGVKKVKKMKKKSNKKNIVGTEAVKCKLKAQSA
jgi:hypothetical protein